MNLLLVFLSIVGTGLYYQTKYIGSTDWIQKKLYNMPESFLKTVLTRLLWFNPFYHGDTFDIRYLTISAYFGSWKKYKSGFQYSKPRNVGFTSENFKRHSWFGIHFCNLVLEFHFSWSHQGSKWYRPKLKNITSLKTYL